MGHSPHTTRAHMDTSTNPNQPLRVPSLITPQWAPLVAFMIGLMLARTTRRGQRKGLKTLIIPSTLLISLFFQTIESKKDKKCIGNLGFFKLQQLHILFM